MKCRPWRWIWGLIPILVLSWFTISVERERIEVDLGARAKKALVVSGYGWAKPAFIGRDAVLTGHAMDEAEPVRAAQILLQVWGVRVVQNQTALVDKVSQYSWAASRKAGRIKLWGYVPNEASRKAVIGLVKANFPKQTVDDRMKLGRGAPTKNIWLGGINFGLKQLVRLKRGRVELVGTGLSVHGEALDSIAYKSVRSALDGKLPSGIKLVRKVITPPIVKPFSWMATFNGGRLQLSGYVPSEQAREAIANAIAKRFSKKVAVVDRMNVAGGAPAHWQVAVVIILEQLARLEKGKASLSDAVLAFSGVSAQEATAQDVQKRVHAGLPAIFKSSERVTFRLPTVKPVAPFVTTIDAGSEEVVVRGYVPDNAARLMLLNEIEARFKGRQVNDRSKIAAGAAKGWRNCLLAGLDGIARLRDGRVALIDRRMTVMGRSEDEAVAGALPGRVRAAAGRACEVNVRVALNLPPEPDLDWRARYETKKIVLVGEVPGQASKAALIAAAAKYFKGAKVVDRMRIADMRSKKWLQAADLGLRILALLRKGEARLLGQSMIVVGEAADTAIAGRVRGSLSRDLPKGYSGRESLTIRSAAMIWAEKEAQRKVQEETERRLQKLQSAKQKSKSQQKAANAKRPETDAERRRLAKLRADEERVRVQIDGARRQVALAERRRAEAAAKQAARRQTDEARILAMIAKARKEAEKEEDQRREAVRRAKEQVEEDRIRKTIEQARRAAEADAALPYAWTVVFDGDALHLSGQVPSERVRAQFLREARLALPGAEVRDDMVVAARGAPENWTKVAMLGLEQLVTLKQGRVHLDKRAGLRVSGKTDNRAVFHAVQAALSKPMFGFAVSSDGIRFENRQEGKLDVERELAHAREVSAGICQQLLTSVAAKGTIRFRKASAKLAVGSFETLDKVVLAAKKCPKVAIRIAGHTDSDGPADYNQRLSEARAGSVASYLSRAGVSQSRLAAVGYGEAKPIAPNDTFDNKARNRRIEFVVTTR